MDTNKKGKRAEYWEETATSYERRKIILYKQEYHDEGRRGYRPRKEEETTREWDQRMNTNRKERHLQEDHCRSEYNYYIQERQ